MFSRYTNQYKKPEEGTLSKLMGGFDNKPVEKSLGLEVDKPSFAVDATLGQLPPKGPPALDPSPTEQPSRLVRKRVGYRTLGIKLRIFLEPRLWVEKIPLQELKKGWVIRL
jgi:hypothetical protein